MLGAWTPVFYEGVVVFWGEGVRVFRGLGLEP